MLKRKTKPTPQKLGFWVPTLSPDAPVAVVRKPKKFMNGTEERYCELLELRRKAGEISQWWFQPAKFILNRVIEVDEAGNEVQRSTALTLDFMVMNNDGSIEFHDTKGSFTREDAWLKMKQFASIYPFPVVIASYVKKAWSYKRVEG